MQTRRVAPALLTVSLLLGSLPFGVVDARAQVEDAQQQANQAKADVRDAYAVVDQAVADRDAVEAKLFDALNRYQQAAAELDAANVDLSRVENRLAFVEASASNLDRSLQQQAVAAYIEALSSPAALVLNASGAESALLVDEVLRTSQSDAVQTLDDLVYRRRQLDDLRAGYADQRDHVAALTTQLQAESDELTTLFQQADAAVATAYGQARQADVAYRNALSAVDRAKAAEEAKRRQESLTTTTTTPNPTTTATTAPGATSPPTTSQPPPIPLSSATLAWRPVVAAHFAPDLVDQAMVIIQCESLGDPNAVNPYSGAAGLFQFLPGTWAVASVKAGVAGSSVFDGEANVTAAAWLAEYYRSRGYNPWQPWACRSWL